MFDFLHRLGGKTGLITASEFFLYSAKDRKCIDVCRARGYRFPRVTSWIRATKEDLKLARDMEFDETGMLTSVSDYHIFSNWANPPAGHGHVCRHGLNRRWNGASYPAATLWT